MTKCFYWFSFVTKCFNGFSFVTKCFNWFIFVTKCLNWFSEGKGFYVYNSNIREIIIFIFVPNMTADLI